MLLTGCAPSRRSVVGAPSPVWPLETRFGGRGSDITRQPAPPAADQFAGATQVMPRSAWTTDRPRVALANRMGRIERITIHHDAMDAAGFRSASDAKRRLSDIHRIHTDNNGWADIGYHYAIDPMGNIWSARPVNLQGAHVRDWNEHNLGIMLMGNFMYEQPTPRALASLQSLVQSESARYRVSAARVGTHRELGNTACPGDRLQAEIDGARARRVRGFA